MRHGRRSMAPPQAGTRRRREGRREAAWLLASALLATVLFASGALDLAVARAFYHPEPLDHWPLTHRVPWWLLYRAAPWVTGTLVIAGLAGLALGLRSARRGWRRAAVLVLLGVALAPGLLANALFKDHWQHPRPRDLIEFGGPLHYVPSPLIGAEGGASFPCGHCSVGFLLDAGWWVWERRRTLLLGYRLVGVARLRRAACSLVPRAAAAERGRGTRRWRPALAPGKHAGGSARGRRCAAR